MDLSPIFPAFLFNPAWSLLVAAPPRYVFFAAISGSSLGGSNDRAKGCLQAFEQEPSRGRAERDWAGL